IFAATPDGTYVPFHFVARQLHCKPTEVDSEKGKCEIPAEVESNGQPQIAAAQKSPSEQDAEPGGINDAQPDGVGIHQMQSSEYGGHREYRRIRSPGSEQGLKTLATEEEFLARGAGQQSSSREEKNIPARGRVACGHKLSRMDRKRREQDE